jgi:hypothetical protein
LAQKQSGYATKFEEFREWADIIVIDGIDRKACVESVLKGCKRNALIIFDNSDWYPKSCAKIREYGFLQIDFVGFGPINEYKWATSIFVQPGSIGTLKHKNGILAHGLNFIGENQDDG